MFMNHRCLFKVLERFLIRPFLELCTLCVRPLLASQCSLLLGSPLGVSGFAHDSLFETTLTFSQLFDSLVLPCFKAIIAWDPPSA